MLSRREGIVFNVARVLDHYEQNTFEEGYFSKNFSLPITVQGKYYFPQSQLLFSLSHPIIPLTFRSEISKKKQKVSFTNLTNNYVVSSFVQTEEKDNHLKKTVIGMEYTLMKKGIMFGLKNSICYKTGLFNSIKNIGRFTDETIDGFIGFKPNFIFPTSFTLYLNNGRNIGITQWGELPQSFEFAYDIKYDLKKESDKLKERITFESGIQHTSSFGTIKTIVNSKGIISISLLNQINQYFGIQSIMSISPLKTSKIGYQLKLNFLF